METWSCYEEISQNNLNILKDLLNLVYLKTILFALLVFSIAVPVTMVSAAESNSTEIMINDSIQMEDSVTVTINPSMTSLKLQLENTANITDLSCPDSDQFLILKHSDDSPACVNYPSKEKLIDRGWGVAIPIDDLADIEQIKIFKQTRET